MARSWKINVIPFPIKRLSPYGESKPHPKYERRERTVLTLQASCTPTLLRQSFGYCTKSQKWLLHSMRILSAVGQAEVFSWSFIQSFTEGDILWPHFHSEVRDRAKWLPASGFCRNSLLWWYLSTPLMQVMGEEHFSASRRGGFPWESAVPWESGQHQRKASRRKVQFQFLNHCKGLLY